VINKSKHEYILSVEILAKQLQVGLFDYFGKNLALAKIMLENDEPNYAISEIDPNDWLASLKAAMRVLFARYYFCAEDISAITITGDFGIIVPTDNKGNAIRKAIINTNGKIDYALEDILKDKSFLDLDVFKSKNWSKEAGSQPLRASQEALSALLYFKHKLDAIYNQTDLFLEAKDFLAIKLGAAPFSTPDSAISNHFVDISDNQYIPKLLNICGIDGKKLPPIVASAMQIGELNALAAEELGLVKDIPIFSADSIIHTNILGAGLLHQNSGLFYAGHDAWISQSIGSKLLNNKEISTTIFSNRTFAHSVRFGGLNVLDFFIKNFTLENNSKDEIEKFARFFELAQQSVSGAHKLFFVPMHAQNYSNNETFSGFYRTQYQHKTADFVRSVLEGIIFFAKLKFSEIQKFTSDTEEITAIGDMACNPFFVQLIADIFARNVNVPDHPDAASLRGAAFLVSLQKNRITPEDIASLVKAEKIVEPDKKGSEKYAYLYEKFMQINYLS